MDALLGSVNLEVSYPHILPLEVIYEVSHPFVPLPSDADPRRVHTSVHIPWVHC